MSKSCALILANNFVKRVKRIWSVSILLTLILATSVTSAVYAEVVINTIPVDNKPAGNELNALAYDSGKGELFVSDLANNVSVISDSTNTVIATVNGTSRPIFGMAYDSGKNEVFVTNYRANTTSVISDNTNAVVATVNVGSDPYGVAYDSGKSEIFVVNSYSTVTGQIFGSGTVSVISDSNNTVVATVNVGNEPEGIAYDSAKGEVFVANYDSNTVSVISDSTNTVVATVNVENNPTGLTYDSGKNEVFVASDASNIVSVISDSTNTVVATVTGASSLSPYGVAYDSEKGEIFVINYEYDTVSVISDNNNTVVATVKVGSGPFGVAYDSQKGEIFVINYSSGTVSVISDSILSPVKVQYVGDITINSDGSVTPSNAPVQQAGNVYTLTSDVDGDIGVSRNNAVFNGNGHTVMGVLSIGNWGSNSNPPTAGLSFASNITVENFTVTGSDYGIELIFMSNAIVANNTITGTGNGILSMDEQTAGIDVEGGDSNIITGNDLSHNYDGMLFLETENNLIVGNNITDSSNPYGLSAFGILFWGASNNTIYHNNFVNNAEQAYDDITIYATGELPLASNIWDDGYPSGGNYWSDYLTKYPNTTEIGSSGIGNTPYVIDTQNEDRYPLMEPFTSAFYATYLLETTPLKISILSPVNQIYNDSSVSLVFSVDKSVNWSGYSLDGRQNITISGNGTIINIPNGLHSVTVYANDTFGNVGASQTISFTVAKPEPFPIATVATVSGVAVMVVVGAGLLVYFKKHRY